MIALYSIEPAIQSASSPLMATSANSPSSRRPAADEARHLEVILDDQDTHGTQTFLALNENRMNTDGQTIWVRGKCAWGKIGDTES